MTLDRGRSRGEATIIANFGTNMGKFRPVLQAIGEKEVVSTRASIKIEVLQMPDRQGER
ncbi:hypothetical protein J7416_03495 [Ruegeria sp. R14_0]|nr:hypothetical protein [Ruegeria sp. R14_0]